MRRLVLLSLVIPLAALGGLAATGCGGADDNDPAPTPNTSASPYGGGVGPPPGGGGSGDPVISCMAQKGFKVSGPADITTPEAQQALAECLQGIHGGGGGVPPY
jgi:hypothetical protein